MNHCHDDASPLNEGPNVRRCLCAATLLLLRVGGIRCCKQAGRIPLILFCSNVIRCQPAAPVHAKDDNTTDDDRRHVPDRDKYAVQANPGMMKMAMEMMQKMPPEQMAAMQRQAMSGGLGRYMPLRLCLMLHLAHFTLSASMAANLLLC